VTDHRRTIRTTPLKTLRLDDGLTTVLAAELLDPSPEVWVVSPWISDVPVLDNTDGGFDVLVGDGQQGAVLLSTVLARMAQSGTHLHVAVRPDDHNAPFVERLTRAVDEHRLTVHHAADVHEKTMCGSTWIVGGSMNFTWRGISVNDEVVVIEIDPQLAAQARLELQHRWAPA
jgi:hypothetical protein